MHHTENMAPIVISQMGDFFNENETTFRTIVVNGGEGFYVVKEDLSTGGFTSCEKVDSVPEDLTTDEEGRIVTETETERTHYIRFVTELEE